MLFCKSWNPRSRLGRTNDGRLFGLDLCLLVDNSFKYTTAGPGRPSCGLQLIRDPGRGENGQGYITRMGLCMQVHVSTGSLPLYLFDG